MLQNRLCITKLTDRLPSWIGGALPRTSSNDCPATFLQSVEFQGLHEREDEDWIPPVDIESSTTSSSRVGSFESLTDTFLDTSALEDDYVTPTSPYSYENFAWGLPRIFPQNSSISLSSSSSRSCPSSGSSSSIETDVDQLTADKERSLESLLKPYRVNGWSPGIDGIHSKQPFLENVFRSLPMSYEVDSINGLAKVEDGENAEHLVSFRIFITSFLIFKLILSFKHCLSYA